MSSAGYYKYSKATNFDDFYFYEYNTTTYPALKDTDIFLFKTHQFIIYKLTTGSSNGAFV